MREWMFPMSQTNLEDTGVWKGAALWQDTDPIITTITTALEQGETGNFRSATKTGDALRTYFHLDCVEKGV